MFGRAVASLGRLVGRPQAPDPAERRLTVRHDCDVETTLRPAGQLDSAPVSAKVRDVSHGGMRLAVSRAFMPRELLSVELPAGDGRPPTTVLAYVVHARQNGAEWVLGCMFASELDDVDLEAFGGARVAAGAGDGRRWVRTPCNVHVECEAVRGPARHRQPARVLDISASGCGLGVAAPVEVGALLSLRLTGAGGRAPVAMLALVVRVSPQPAGEWVLGCTFLRDLSDEELRSLLAHAGAPGDPAKC